MEAPRPAEEEINNEAYRKSMGKSLARMTGFLTGMSAGTVMGLSLALFLTISSGYVLLLFMFGGMVFGGIGGAVALNYMTSYSISAYSGVFWAMLGAFAAGILSIFLAPFTMGLSLLLGPMIGASVCGILGYVCSNPVPEDTTIRAVEMSNSVGSGSYGFMEEEGILLQRPAKERQSEPPFQPPRSENVSLLTPPLALGVKTHYNPSPFR